MFAGDPIRLRKGYTEGREKGTGSTLREVEDKKEKIEQAGKKR